MAGTAAVAGGAPTVHRPQGVKRIEVAVTCDASGVLSETVIGEAYGRLVNVFYDGGLDASAAVVFKQKPGAASLVSAPMFTYTTGTEGTPVAFRPTTIVADSAGAALTAGDGSGGAGTGNDVNRDIYVAGKITIAVTSGGVSETCKFALVFDETPLPPTFDKADLS